VSNPDFSSPAINCNNYAYQSATGCGGASYPTQNLTGSGWNFGAAGDGLAALGSAFNLPAAVPAPFTQAAFLQGDGASVVQGITAMSAGSWTVSFYLGSRYASGSYDGTQTVQVLLDGNPVGLYSLTNGTPFTQETITIPGVTAATHQLEFLGTTPGDHTAFVSDVSVSSAGSPVPVADPNFSSPGIDCNNYAYQSTTTCGGASYPTQDFSGNWVFGSTGGGLTAAGSAFNPPPFALFGQAAFLQGAGASVDQEINGPAGLWKVSFYLGSRYASGSYDGNQTVEVLLDGNVVQTYGLSSNMPFTLETVTIPVSIAGTHDLEFLGIADGDHTAFVSDVSIGVPEPGSLPALGADLTGLGLILLGLRSWRSRRCA
jgi:hypothetical protein